MAVLVPILIGVAAVDYVFDFGWLRCVKEAITCRHCIEHHTHNEGCCVEPDAPAEG